MEDNELARGICRERMVRNRDIRARMHQVAKLGMLTYDAFELTG